MNEHTSLPVAGNLPVLTINELDADPHGVFRTYRSRHPLVAHETGSYLVLRYGDVERLSRDSRAQATGTAHPELLGVTEGSLFETFEHGMLSANGEVHRRRRSPFSRTFASRMIAELRPVIRQSANDLISGWYGDGTVEFIEKFAALVPARAISDLLGLPRADIPAFTKLVCSLTPSL